MTIDSVNENDVRIAKAFYTNLMSESNRAAMKIERCKRLITLRQFGFKEQKIAEFYACHPHFLTDAFDSLKGIFSLDNSWRRIEGATGYNHVNPENSFGITNLLSPFLKNEGYAIEALTLIKNMANEMYSDKKFPDIVNLSTSSAREELYRKSVEEDRKIEDLDFEIVRRSGTVEENAEIVPVLYRFWYDKALPKTVHEFLKRFQLDEETLGKEFNIKNSEEMVRGVEKVETKGGTLKPYFPESVSFNNTTTFQKALHYMINKLGNKDKDKEMWRFFREEEKESDTGGIDRNNGENSSMVISEKGFGRKITWNPFNRLASQVKGILNPLVWATGGEQIYDKYESEMFDNPYSYRDNNVVATTSIEMLATFLSGYTTFRDVEKTSGEIIDE